jgi:hypothetical protein
VLWRAGIRADEPLQLQRAARRPRFGLRGPRRDVFL